MPAQIWYETFKNIVGDIKFILEPSVFEKWMKLNGLQISTEV